MGLDVLNDDRDTQVGSYFVANYPPFSVWSPEHVPALSNALNQSHEASEAAQPAPLGLYLHIPFCRKRCKFCYFRVYTDKNSSDVESYLDALSREIGLYAECAALADREFDFVYFGGGTPSFLSSQQLTSLIDRIRRHWKWEHAREVTFECEPGTLKKSKLETIKSIGTTRLSLGVEHFDDAVLEIGGRAHRSAECFDSYQWAREVGFDQINIDLIAGMVGDTEAKWRDTVEKAVALDADSVTIYQMEVPHNTIIARESGASHESTAVASWATKRAWVDHAFAAFEAAGYVVSSAYTLAKPPPDPAPTNGEVSRPGFVYRDGLWHGADLVGTGVASFGHLGGVHYQNADAWEDYIERLNRSELPVSRALPITKEQSLIREMILQLKLGRLSTGYFKNKFDVQITERFAKPFASLVDDGFAEINGDDVCLTRAGLLRVDGLLPRFFEPQFTNIRYT